MPTNDFPMVDVQSIRPLEGCRLWVRFASQLIELFFFPVPSVKDLRDQFQAKIGWNK